jgi:hypothetical protein
VTDRKGEAPEAPTPIARRYVSYVVGFGVAVGIGLAPFLGKVAGVDALLNLFPRSLHGSLIPLSAFLMGFIAVVIQFYSGESLSRALLRRRFKVAWLLLLAGFVLLFSFHTLFVVPVPYKTERGTIPVLIGSSRIQGGSCQCAPTDSDKQCIQKLSFDPAAIETCWGSGSIKLRGYLLSLSYLMVTGGFGALIGLLLLTEQARQQKKRRPRKAAATSPDSAPAQGTS